MTTLEGQWLGQGGGTNTGWTVLEVERRKGALYGSALLFDEDLANPSILAEIGPITSDTPTSLQARLFPIDRWSGAVLSEVERQKRFPDTQLSKTATIEFPRVSDLLCMNNLAHASLTKEHDDNDDIQGSFRRAA